MIGRWSQAEPEEVVDEPKGFDDFDLRLGDIMRGERATMGKSLLDVQRELKIKASYIAAIENADPTAFDTPGFIAGFVRSYARYLNLDPDWAFQTFCDEGQFETAHGMSEDALPERRDRKERAAGADPLSAPAVPFTPEREGFMAAIEPRAVGSSLVLLLLVGGLGFGGYSVLQEVQRVDVAPVEQAPTAVVQLDPLAGATQQAVPATEVTAVAPSSDVLDRLYRPPALDVPVLVARDAPIASINANEVGVFAQASLDGLPSVDDLSPVSGLQVVDGPAPEVVLFASAPTWVRIQTPDRSVLFEKILETGEGYAIPVTEETPILRADNSGALYFKVNGEVVGPAGEGQSSVKDVLLASTDLSAAFQTVTPEEDQALFDLLSDLNAPDVLPKRAGAEPAVVASLGGPVSLMSTDASWVRVRNGEGKVVYEGTINPDTVQSLPEDAEAPTLRAGNSGSLFFVIGDEVYGPAGAAGSTVRNVDLTPLAVRAAYPKVDRVIPGLAATE